MITSILSMRLLLGANTLNIDDGDAMFQYLVFVTNSVTGGASSQQVEGCSIDFIAASAIQY